MISGTFFVLLTTGLLSVVMALPLHSITYYQDEAGKQGHTAYFPNYYQAAGQGNAQSQGYGVTFPQEQSNDAENQWKVSVGWAKQQNLYPYWNNYQGVAKGEGIRIRIPQQQLTAKEEGHGLDYIQQRRYRPYVYQQGIRVNWPYQQAKKESITYRWPQLRSGKEQRITFTYPQKQLTSANEQEFARSIGRALCKAANGTENIAEVAAYIQVNFHSVQKAVDYLKRFGRELCNDIIGDGGSMKAKKPAILQLSEEVENELLTDKN